MQQRRLDFSKTTRIGFREQWQRLVREKGYQVVGHDLIPIANDETADSTGEATLSVGSVARHLTALTRHLRPLFRRYGVESGHHRLVLSISAFDRYC
jgi:hypothetical protein